MNFDDLRFRWEEAGKPTNLACVDRLLDGWLRDPADRLWLTVCVNWLRQDPPGCCLPEPELLKALFPHSHVLNGAQAYVDLLRLMQASELSQEQLRMVAKTRGLAIGQITEIYYELQGLRSGRTSTASDGQLCCGPMRIADKICSGPILLLSHDTEVAATLTLELIAENDSDSAIWRIPALMLLAPDERWERAERQVLNFLTTNQLRPENSTFRYRITLPADSMWHLSISGDSWAGQAMLLLLRVIPPSKEVGKMFSMLRSLQFRGVAITAGVLDENGLPVESDGFVPVRGFFRKMLAGIKRAHPRITTFIIAKSQSFDSLAYKRHPLEYPIWKDIDSNLTILKAKSLSDALKWLDRLQQPGRRARRVIGGAGLALLLFLVAILLWPVDLTPRMQELALSVMRAQSSLMERMEPDHSVSASDLLLNDSINSVLTGWARKYRYSRVQAIDLIRRWSTKNSRDWRPAPVTVPSAATRKLNMCAIFLRDKMEQIDPQLTRETSEWRIETNGLVLKWIPAGEFWMGSPRGDPFAGPNEPYTKRVIAKPFWIGKFEVTQGEFQAVMGSNKNYSFFNDSKYLKELYVTNNYKWIASRPLETVTYDQAILFCLRLTQSESSRISRLNEPYEFRLPTEVEWEYACRAGENSRYPFGDNPSDLSQYAWFSKRTTAAVGLRFPNNAGLYDIIGNVNEMCLEVETGRCVVRGGSFLDSDGSKLRCAYRFGWETNKDGNTLGFRIVLGPKIEGTPPPIEEIGH